MEIKMIGYIIKYYIILLKEWIFRANFPLIFFVVFSTLVTLAYIVKTYFPEVFAFTQDQYFNFIYFCSAILIACMVGLALRKE